MTRRVLLVEDDPRVRRALRLALEDEGYRVAEAGTGVAALDEARRHEPDVVLLDVVLPDIDGLMVCRELRRESDVPVIMVTARTDSADIVAGLEAGADDYVTKPLVAQELSARIRALLRRAVPTRAVVGPPVTGATRLDIDPFGGKVMRGDTEVRLTRTEFRMLAELVVAGDGGCTREELLERVWGYGYFGDSRIVDVHVRRLRVKLEDDPSSPQHVLTVRGHGYRFAD